jgi:tetratricopeptide (TPR) repeat protein
MVSGESGVGKTTLLQELASRVVAQGAVVIHGRCFERETVPYKAVDALIDGLSKLVSVMPKREAEALCPPDIAVVGNVFPVLRRVAVIAGAEMGPRASLSPHELRGMLFSAVRELFTRLSRTRPLVLVVDDVQWADGDSLALLAEILRPPGAQLLLIMTVRAALESERETRSAAQIGEQLGVAVRQVRLEGLAPEDARQLARSVAERAGLTVDLDAVALEAHGHPLFIETLLRSRSPSKASNLEAALWHTIAKLRPVEQRILELLAVAGGPIGQGTAARAAGLDTATQTEALLSLRAAHLVKSTGTRASDSLEPYHHRVRNAVLLHLLPAHRTDWHHRLASSLEADGGTDSEALLIHWEGAGELAKAGRYAARAALEASAALAFDRAARLYRRATELDPASPDVTEWTVALAEALANAGRGAEAAEAFLDAARNDSSRELDLRRRAADQFLRGGHIDRGLDALRDVLATVDMTMPATPKGALAALLVRRAQVRLRGLSFVARPADSVDPALLTRIDVCNSVGVTLGLVDNIRASYFQSRTFLWALQAGEPLRLAKAFAQEAAFSSADGGKSRARTALLAEKARNLAASTGDPYTIVWCGGLHGMAVALEGRWLEASRMCEEAEKRFRSGMTGVSFEVSLVRWFGLWSMAYLGRIATMASLLPARLRDAEQRGDLHAVIGHSTAMAGLVWLAEDNPDEARRRADDAMKRWSQATFHVEHWWNMHGQALIDLYRGDGQSALAGLEREWPRLSGAMLLMVQATRLEATLCRGRARVLCARATSAGERARHLRHARSDAKTVLSEDMPWASALARLTEAGCLAIEGRNEQAIEVLGMAASGADSASMRLFAAAARYRLGALIGGDEGSALREGSQTVFSDEGVRNVERMLSLLAPGFP